ncbi:hypothetical protein [Mycoplasma todarodis]|uniref:hypothetical protein n=1 Tax=Mycoplasma todarodis TaxID=1937191 RepID=UPI003B3066D4
MGKFSPRRIVTMIIIAVAALLGIILGAMALTNGDHGHTISKSFNKDALDLLPNNQYKGAWYLAYYGGYIAVAIGAIAGLLFVIGMILTFVKGKSFGWIMLGLGIVLLLAALIVGFLAHAASKELLDSAWVAKHPPYAPAGK